MDGGFFEVGLLKTVSVNGILVKRQSLKELFRQFIPVFENEKGERVRRIFGQAKNCVNHSWQIAGVAAKE